MHEVVVYSTVMSMPRAGAVKREDGEDLLDLYHPWHVRTYVRASKSACLPVRTLLDVCMWQTNKTKTKLVFTVQIWIL